MEVRRIRSYAHIRFFTGGQFSSRGVQVGGVGSATGVVGIWTTTTHEVGECTLICPPKVATNGADCHK